MRFVSFDKDRVAKKRFAVYFDFGRSSKLYLFKGKRMIELHRIYHHYGLELRYFKAGDGNVIFYYQYVFVAGTGVSQSNFFCYKYEQDKILPVFNELALGNLHSGCGTRTVWLQSKMIKYQPLTLKMVYYQALPDTQCNNLKIVDDSVFVTYSWNGQSKMLEGNFPRDEN